jgi:hypothetical protein
VYFTLDKDHVEVWSLEQRDGHLLGLVVRRGIVLAHVDVEGLYGAQGSCCRFPVEVAERQVGGKVVPDETPYIVGIIVCGKSAATVRGCRGGTCDGAFLLGHCVPLCSPRHEIDPPSLCSGVMMSASSSVASV